MARYVDGFVIPIPKRNLAVYRRMAQVAAAVWREYGALDYKECIGDDLKVKWGPGFLRSLKVKTNETVVFSWIVFKSRAHRDRVNAKVMQDPRIRDAAGAKEMPFEMTRMLYGGFNVIVDA